MRNSVLAASIAFSVMATAPWMSDPSTDAAYYDNRTSTGGNIPRKGSAIIVDKSVIEDQISRQGRMPA